MVVSCRAPMNHAAKDELFREPPRTAPAATRFDPGRAARSKTGELQVISYAFPRDPVRELERSARGHLLDISVTSAGPWSAQWSPVIKYTGRASGRATTQSDDATTLSQLAVPHEVLEPLKRLVMALGTPAIDLLGAITLQLSRRALDVSDGYALGFIVRNARHLRVLSVSHNPTLTADGVWPIAQAVAMCPCLTSLDLSHISLLRRALTAGDGNPHGLDARHDHLEARALSVLSASLRKTSVRELALEGNAMRQKELHLLSPAWSAVANADQPLLLETLRIGHNELGASGAAELARSLSKVGSLRVLDVRANRIGNAGAAAIAQLLDTAPKLRSLCVRENEISSQGIAALARSTALADWLSLLDLSLNPVGVGGDAGVRALGEVVGNGGAPRLTQVILVSCGLGASHRQRLRAASAARLRLPPHPTFGLRHGLHLVTMQ